MELEKYPKQNNDFNLPWVEKYRPKVLNNIIGQEKIVDSLKNLFENGSFPHLLFYGGSGCGKTSTILSLINQYFGKKKKLMVMRLDASDDRGINSVRDEIKAFAEKKNYFMTGVKVIILDEADSMTFDAQFALRRIIEKYSRNTRFCLICNYENKIIPAIKSRCAEFKFNSISNNFVISRLDEICKSENVKVSKKILETIGQISKGDLRKAVNLLQTISLTNPKDITIDLCYSICGFPSKKEINLIYECLINSKISFDKSVEMLKKVISKNGYSISMILKELCEIMIMNISSNKLDENDYFYKQIGAKSNFRSNILNDSIISESEEIHGYLETKSKKLPNYIKILSELSDLENMVVKSTFGDIYLSSLVAIFKKIDD